MRLYGFFRPPFFLPYVPRRKTDEAFQDLLEALKLSPQNHDIRRALEQLRDESTLMGISGDDEPFKSNARPDCKGLKVNTIVTKRSFDHERLPVELKTAPSLACFKTRLDERILKQIWSKMNCHCGLRGAGDQPHWRVESFFHPPDDKHCNHPDCLDLWNDELYLLDKKRQKWLE